jgi:hypothetical protein
MNNFSKQIVMHSIQSAASNVIMDWNNAADTLMNKAKKAKNEFQSAFNSGMDSIISGVKSFASLWKSGW